LLALFIPLVVDLLRETEEKLVSKHNKHLHDFALDKLKKIGPMYPQEFKVVIGASADLKQRLETALRASQAAAKETTYSTRSQIRGQPAAPTIKLKTTFGNF
jgi:hypothetical protein